LTEHRRELVGDKTRLTNRLTNTLKQYYPQTLDWFEQRDTVLFIDFLTRWPSVRASTTSRRSSMPIIADAPRSSTLVSSPSNQPYRSRKTLASLRPVGCTR
jgi:hypothetical protein